MAADVRAEAHKGRFSVIAEYLYLSLSTSTGTDSAVKKLDFRLDQHLADFGLAWRVLESSRGYLDVTAGFRYNNFYQRLTLQPNDSQIEDVSQKLAVAASAARIAQALNALKGQNPPIGIAPIDAAAIKRLGRAIPKIKGSTAEKQQQIADLLHRTLSGVVARTDDWVDPYLGLRGQYDLNERFYLTGKADIGGFGIGSDIAWRAEAAVGMHVTKNAYSEIGYRAIGLDYRQNGLVMDTITHGVLLTLGLAF
jgi:hypothetical protein